ncbi:NADPH:quinone oxidoreductase family protein [Novosphingobium colocasiae]|uniref:NADPH:quinone oxidoreductase n=1 Tax=Novosphingobium colocasiae TaxID=1256513 RepID=A0A918PC38_9SPHN|nr:NADPH:quinone oxidoreductase family protein [Novosphingobium colocasiae]GGY95689.1 NADPH:quinone oxidoreductase [Novosphingobium colocasiae]
MKAIQCVAFGAPEDLIVADVPLPEPGPGELRVRVHAAAVNYPDGLIVQGLYQHKPALPFVPGLEAAGVIDAVGPGCSGFAPGERVAAMAPVGAYAEAMIVPAEKVVKLDDAMSFAHGAAFCTTYGTAYHALVQRGRLAARETLLVLGAAGGVGLAAVQIGKALGARVIAAASTPAKLALAKAMGADALIDYSTEDLRERVKEITGGRGVDVVYDPLGDRFAEPAMRSLAWDGRYLVVGFAAGEIPRLPTNILLLKNAAILGVFYGEWARREPAANRDNLAALFRLYREADVRPHIDRTFALEDAATAIRFLLDRKVMGKVVLTM